MLGDFQVIRGSMVGKIACRWAQLKPLHIVKLCFASKK